MTFSVKSSLPAGDLLSALPGLRQIYRDTGRKAIVYQILNVQGNNDGSSPFQDNYGNAVFMNGRMFNTLKPLLLGQDYIEDYTTYSGEPIDIDIDKTRNEYSVNIPYGLINRWPSYIYPQMQTDLSEKWLTAPERAAKPTGVIINFTERYRNQYINYFFLKEYQGAIVFIGLPEEHEKFCATWSLDIPYHRVKDFKHAADLINSCHFYMGSQSSLFQIAEGLKISRLLEVCKHYPNVIPQGKNGYDATHQLTMEWLFKKLYNA